MCLLVVKCFILPTHLVSNQYPIVLSGAPCLHTEETSDITQWQSGWVENLTLPVYEQQIKCQLLNLQVELWNASLAYELSLGTQAWKEIAAIKRSKEKKLTTASYLSWDHKVKGGGLPWT